MIKGVIFDVDGVLLNSMPIWENLGELYLRSLGERQLNVNQKNFFLDKMIAATRLMTREIKMIIRNPQ